MLHIDSDHREIDVREMPCVRRRATITDLFDRLKPGQSFMIVNNHDPLPLRHFLEQRAEFDFDWAYVESGPDVWRIEVTRQ